MSSEIFTGTPCQATVNDAHYIRSVIDVTKLTRFNPKPKLAPYFRNANSNDINNTNVTPFAQMRVVNEATCRSSKIQLQAFVDLINYLNSNDSTTLQNDVVLKTAPADFKPLEYEALLRSKTRAISGDTFTPIELTAEDPAYYPKKYIETLVNFKEYLDCVRRQAAAYDPDFSGAVIQSLSFDVDTHNSKIEDEKDGVVLAAEEKVILSQYPVVLRVNYALNRNLAHLPKGIDINDKVFLTTNRSLVIKGAQVVSDYIDYVCLAIGHNYVTRMVHGTFTDYERIILTNASDLSNPFTSAIAFGYAINKSLFEHLAWFAFPYSDVAFNKRMRMLKECDPVINQLRTLTASIFYFQGNNYLIDIFGTKTVISPINAFIFKPVVTSSARVVTVDSELVKRLLNQA